MKKMTVREFKQDLKEKAVALRQAKLERDTGSNQAYMMSQVAFLKKEYRHMHIAYCLFRGTEYSAIEPKCREGNEPKWSIINNIMANIIPTEPKQDAEVVCVDSQ